MKVGIVTFFSAYNYGAFLQTYALQEKIIELGYDVEIINYRPKIFDSYKPFNWSTSSDEGNTMRRFLSLAKYYIPRCKKKYIFENSIKHYFKITNEINSYCTNLDTIDTLVFGSDQIWSIKLLKQFDEIYWGTCFANVKKISYAASAGQSYKELENEMRVQKALKDFNKVGVREQQLKNILEEKFNIDSTVTLDPTLLHDSQFWSLFAGKFKKRSKPYILLYIAAYSPNAMKAAEIIAKEKNLEIINLYPSAPYSKILESYSFSPQEFVGLIKNANYIITTSFHAVAFSIIFKKNFYAIKGVEENSRVETLLSTVDLENRYIDLPILIEDIDFDKCNGIIEKSIEKSLDFLKNSLLN